MAKDLQKLANKYYRSVFGRIEVIVADWMPENDVLLISLVEPEIHEADGRVFMESPRSYADRLVSSGYTGLLRHGKSNTKTKA